MDGLAVVYLRTLGMGEKPRKEGEKVYMRDGMRKAGRQEGMTHIHTCNHTIFLKNNKKRNHQAATTTAGGLAVAIE